MPAPELLALVTEFFSSEQCLEGLKFTFQSILLGYSCPYWLTLGNASDCALFEDVGSDVGPFEPNSKVPKSPHELAMET